MRLAYLIHTFPLYSLTFVVDEIKAMRLKGSSIDLFGVRRPPKNDYPECYEAYAEETTYVLPVAIFTHLFHHLELLFTHPIRYFSSIFYILTSGGISWRQRLKVFVYFCEAIELCNKITDNRYDHLHVHFLFGGAIIAIFLKRLTGIRYSLTAHGTDFLVDRFFISEKIKHSEFVRVGTQYNAEFISQHIESRDREKLFVLPFGIDLKCLSHDKEKTVCRIAQRNNKPVKIINVGRLVWQKGQKDLIEAVSKLNSKGVPLSLEIVGEGDLRAELEALIDHHNLKDIIVLHRAMPREDALEIMSAADIFVFPSISEGFGIVLLEAMMSGLTVVASNANGISEIIRDGHTGSIFQAGSPAGLADKLEELILDEDKRKSFAMNALDDVFTRFNQDDKINLFFEKLNLLCRS